MSNSTAPAATAANPPEFSSDTDALAAWDRMRGAAPLPAVVPGNPVAAPAPPTAADQTFIRTMRKVQAAKLGHADVDAIPVALGVKDISELAGRRDLWPQFEKHVDELIASKPAPPPPVVVTKIAAPKVPAPPAAMPVEPVPGQILPMGAAVAVEQFAQDKGKLVACLPNVLLALRSSNLFDIQIRKDKFLDVIVIRVGGQWRPFTDADYVRLREGLENRGFNGITHEMIRHAVMLVADDNQFDSAIEWLDSLVWDGEPRVDTFLEKYFGVVASPYVTAVSRYLWTALPGRTLTPGVQADMALALVGGQGIQKTKAIKALVRDRDYYVELDLSDKEDNLKRLMRGKQVGEIAELKGLATREAGYIKAFISRTEDEWAPKYLEYTTSLKRRLLMIGTGNDQDFLTDETGNRRWLPLTVVRSADVDAIARDRDQLWAEGAAMYRKSGIQYAEAERLAKAEHGNYFAEDEWQAPIAEWLSHSAGWSRFTPSGTVAPTGAPRGDSPFTSLEVIEGALRILDAAKINKAVQQRVGKVLTALRYRRGFATINGKQVRAWMRAVPPPPVA